MKRMMTIAAAAVLAVALMAPTGALAQTGLYEWAISNSDTDPGQNVGDLVGVANLYLWYTGCNTADSNAGMSAAEFNLIGTGGLVPLAFNPNLAGGWLNAGGSTNLLLAVGGCPATAQVAGTILTNAVSTDGHIGLGVATGTGVAATVACVPDLTVRTWPGEVRFVGYATASYSGAQQDHGNGCTTDAVETSSWGDVKALYR